MLVLVIPIAEELHVIFRSLQAQQVLLLPLDLLQEARVVLLENSWQRRELFLQELFN